MAKASFQKKEDSCNKLNIPQTFSTCNFLLHCILTKCVLTLSTKNQ